MKDLLLFGSDLTALVHLLFAGHDELKRKNSSMSIQRAKQLRFLLCGSLISQQRCQFTTQKLLNEPPAVEKVSPVESEEISHAILSAFIRS